MESQKLSRPIILLALIFQTHSTQAFINVESVRLQDSPGIHGKSKAEVNGKSGNSEKFVLSLESTNSYHFGRNELLGLLSYQYGEATKLKNTNKGSVHLRYTRYHLNYLATEYFIQSQFNEFQKLEHRDLLGIGLRSRSVNRENQFLFIGTGLFYEREKLKTLTESDDWRGNFYLSYLYRAKNELELSTILYYQPNLVFFNDFRIRLQLGLEYKLLSFLSIFNSFSLAHDSKPPDEVLPTDISYKFGFIINY